MGIKLLIVLLIIFFRTSAALASTCYWPPGSTASSAGAVAYTEGTQRYDSSQHQMMYCNGTIFASLVGKAPGYNVLSPAYSLGNPATKAWATINVTSQGWTNATAAVVYLDYSASENNSATVWTNINSYPANSIKIYSNSGVGHDSGMTGGAQAVVPIVTVGSNQYIYLYTSGNTNNIYVTGYYVGTPVTQPSSACGGSAPTCASGGATCNDDPNGDGKPTWTAAVWSCPSSPTGGGGGKSGGDGGGCFTAGTKVQTPNGPVAIEKLTAGDEIFAYDTKKGALAVTKIARKIVHKDARKYGTITFSNGAVVQVTPNHPFYLPREKKWVRADKLNESAIVFTYEQKEASVQSIDFTDKTKRAAVYNFTVTKYHNYFAEGILVHNVDSK